MQVSLNVYDVTNTSSDNSNGMITRLNSITRELNLGGVFHGAVEIDGVEWSFGYCESGTGVYCCHARSNSMYTFRENIELGVTHKTRQEIKEILSRFKRSWQGPAYDLLQRNCCHFCEQLCAALGVAAPPAWLNRFAQGADATVKFTNEASALAKRVGSNLSLTAQQSASWLREVSQRVLQQVAPQQSSGAAADGAEAAAAARASSSASSATAGGWLCSECPVVENGAGGGPAEASGGSARGESAGVGRLAGRLRMFAAGGGAGGGGGLPASTPAAASDAAPAPAASSPPSGFASVSSALPSALRQRWQELEASAGDGTKQFLFGLIKTRQTRLEEEDDALYGSSSSSLAEQRPRSGFGAGTGFRGGDGPSQQPAAEAFLAPPQQVISPTPPLSSPPVPHSNTVQYVAAPGVGPGVGSGERGAGAAVAADVGPAGMSWRQQGHLLDM